MRARPTVPARAGHELSSADWELFLARLDEQRSAVQATALELGAAHPHRVPNELLLALLRDGARTKPAALTVAVLRERLSSSLWHNGCYPGKLAMLADSFHSPCGFSW